MQLSVDAVLPVLAVAPIVPQPLLLAAFLSVALSVEILALLPRDVLRWEIAVAPLGAVHAVTRVVQRFIIVNGRINALFGRSHVALDAVAPAPCPTLLDTAWVVLLESHARRQARRAVPTEAPVRSVYGAFALAAHRPAIRTETLQTLVLARVGARILIVLHRANDCNRGVLSDRMVAEQHGLFSDFIELKSCGQYEYKDRLGISKR